MNARQHKSRRMMPVKAAVLLLSAFIVILPALHARADGDVTDIKGDELVRSMSSPVYWKPHAGLSLTWNQFGDTDRIEGEFRLGIYKDLLNPAIGAFGLNLEGYAGSFAHEFDGGVRLLGEIKFFMLQFGADYLIGEESWTSCCH